ncbi:MAG: heat-inducible transcription repressor HrcA [Acidimicrobiia bacterium]|nr:heat-inducible transcription repressor HrcA [Acidimicrobiia bacterium]
MGLNERCAAVLKAIVEEHIATGAPVGSAAVARRVTFDVSSATVRNDMALLGEEGYVTQPHTSAGRVPQVAGYRYYVDHFADSDALSAVERSTVGTFFREEESEVEHLLQATTRLLARMTNLAAVVVPPVLDDTTLASVHLTRIGSGKVLCILVTRTGRVAKVVIEAEPVGGEDDDDWVHDTVLQTAESALGDLLVGRPDWLKRWPIPEIADPVAAVIVRSVLDALRHEGTQSDVFLEGTAGLADRLDELETVRQMLLVLEGRRRLVDVLVRVDASAETSPVVRIGTELPAQDLSGLALVLASYRLGQTRGLVGLVGPMRIDYSRAMSAVSYISSQLEQTVS